MTSPKLVIDWDTYHSLIYKLAQQIEDSQWQFDSLLCIARGGLRVGDTLSRIFHKPLAILSTSSYTDNDQRGHLKIADHITHSAPLGDRLLVVDDMVDSGVTLSAVVNWLDRPEHQAGRGKFQAIKTAVLWYKAHATTIPDYYASYLTDSPWIVQPFEVLNYQSRNTSTSPP
jgi:hypoxanthine phosphoribosyltransferase